MSSIEERVIKVTTDVLEWGGEVKTESNLIHDLGADSLDMAELVLSLEEEFDIMIDDVEVEGRLQALEKAVASLQSGSSTSGGSDARVDKIIAHLAKNEDISDIA